MSADRINAKMGEGQFGQKPILALLLWQNSQRVSCMLFLLMKSTRSEERRVGKECLL